MNYCIIIIQPISCCQSIYSVQTYRSLTGYFCILLLYYRKPLFRYCYECGRSINVHLTPCSRCKEVYYCSKPCQNKAWETVHKDECRRIPLGLVMAFKHFCYIFSNKFAVVINIGKYLNVITFHESC